MRQLVMRSLSLCALAAFALTARAQMPAPSPTPAPIEDVRRELQAQRTEIEQLRATVAEQTRRLLQQRHRRRKRPPRSPRMILRAQRWLIRCATNVAGHSEMARDLTATP